MSESKVRIRIHMGCIALLIVALGCAESPQEKSKDVSKPASPVERTVRAVIARQLKVNADSIDMKKLLTALNADNLDIIEMVMDLEEELGIVIPDSAIDRYGVRMTAADLVTIATVARANPAPEKKKGGRQK